MLRFFLILSFVTLLFSCGPGSGKNVPPASGLSGDMYLVMDSLQWTGPLGRALDSIFNQEMAGLPHNESIFNLRWINPSKLNFVLKQRRNLIFAVSLDQKGSGARIVKKLFTPASLEKIKSDPTSYVQTVPDIFARNQQVMFLFGNTEAELLGNVKKHGEELIEFFNRTERERLTETLFKSGTLKGVRTWVNKNFQCDVRIPFGYNLAQSESDFLWVRQINPKDDKDFFIASTAYTSQDQFLQDSLVSFRDKICKKYLFEDPAVSDSYLVTETSIPFIPVQSRPINFNGHYAVELRGIWRTNNKSMGGPFMGYAMVDQATKKFYYIEGFTFSPGKDQREIMRELETIMYTFRLSDQLSAKKETP